MSFGRILCQDSRTRSTQKSLVREEMSNKTKESHGHKQLDDSSQTFFYVNYYWVLLQLAGNISI